MQFLEMSSIILMNGINRLINSNESIQEATIRYYNRTSMNRSNLTQYENHGLN